MNYFLPIKHKAAFWNAPNFYNKRLIIFSILSTSPQSKSCIIFFPGFPIIEFNFFNRQAIKKKKDKGGERI